ncbi:alpha carbonic anhydrase [Kalaharituber pfeilii]|nr:alpha carbonic anhydrase [Kalaharituber pfeilii]
MTKLNISSVYTLIIATFTAGASAAAYPGPPHPQAPLTNTDTLVNEYGSSTHVYWDYTGPTGPLMWTKLNRKEWSLCGTGEKQSPINIDSSLTPNSFKYEWSAPPRACYNLTNVGHSLLMRPTCPPIGDRKFEEVELEHGNEEQATEDAKMSIMIEDDWFNLDSIDFHTPSEHRFNDEYYPVEVHFVLKSPNTGRLAIRAIFFDLSSFEESDFWKGITPYLWSVRNPGQWIKLPAVNTRNIMKEFQRAGLDKKVYNYRGSMTAPPCSENVIWDVLSEPQYVSVETYNLLKKIIKFNSRYTQNKLGEGNLLAEVCSKK